MRPILGRQLAPFGMFDRMNLCAGWPLDEFHPALPAQQIAT